MHEGIPMKRSAFLLFGALLLLTGGPVYAAPEVTFSCAMTTDAESGWDIIQLTAENRVDPKKSLTVKITPEGGANLFSFRVGDTDVILGPEKVGDLAGKFLGIPILYPTPNRIRDGVYHFLGEEHTLAHMREFWRDTFMDRRSWDDWEDQGRPDPRGAASAKAKELLATHEPDPLPEDVTAELDGIMEAYERDAVERAG
jgi:hypothetical protein